MRSRPLLLIAVSAALLASAGVSSAGKKCNLVTDAASDANFIGPPGVTPAAPQLDLRSGDVATGKKTLVVVMRLESTDGKAYQGSALGMRYQVDFKINGIAHTFKHELPQNGTSYTDSATANGVAISGLTVKVDAKTITWTVPRSNVPTLKAPKKPPVIGAFFFTGYSPTAHDYAPDNGSPSNATYPDKAPSCVKAA